MEEEENEEEEEEDGWESELLRKKDSSNCVSLAETAMKSKETWYQKKTKESDKTGI